MDLGKMWMGGGGHGDIVRASFPLRPGFGLARSNQCERRNLARRLGPAQSNTCTQHMHNIDILYIYIYMYGVTILSIC
jgi:hypothetical protein